MPPPVGDVAQLVERALRIGIQAPDLREVANSIFAVSIFFSEFDHLIGRPIGLFWIRPFRVLGWRDVRDCILRPVVLSTKSYFLIRHVE